MKKIFNKISLIIILLIIPLNKVSASSINISCPDKATPNQTIECKITGTSDKYISSINAKTTSTENIEIIKFKEDEIWEGGGDSKSFDLYTDINKTNDFNIGTLSIKIKNDAPSKTETISINNIYYYDSNFKEIKVNNISKDIKILSINNNLSNLEVSGHNLSPTFNKNTLEYKLTTSNEKITIEATQEAEKSTITGTGIKELQYGTNKFSVVVTSEAGSKKEYILIVTRLTEDKSKEEIEKPKEQLPKDESLNEQAQEETTETEKDNNNKLKTLKITNYDIEFNSNVYTYNIDIDNNVTKLDILAETSNPKTKITIKGNENLVVGKNEITIIVTAEDNSQTIYKIYANKKSEVCVIESINILNYDLEFSCNKYDYELEIDLEDSLNIEVIPSDKNAKVNIYNNNNLKQGDVIKIIINSNDIDYTYNIKILKKSFELGELFNNKQLIIISTILTLTSIYLLVRLILKRKNKKEF